MRLEEVMVTEVTTIDEKASIKLAVECMNSEEIGCLIVEGKDGPVGIVTERDMINKVLSEGRNPKTLKIRDIMSKPLVTGRPDMSLEDAATLMFQHNIKKLPITSKGQLVGLVTLTDLIRSKRVIAMLQALPTENTSKKMKKAVDYYNRIISISYE